MYGDWQIGHMPLEDYVQKHNRFAEAMRAQDPSIKVIAVGATGEWSETMLTHCADHMDLLSEHFYCGEKPGVSAHMNQIVQTIRTKAEQHRAYHASLPSLTGKVIPIAMDEWNYWYGEELYGEIGVRYFLKDALGVAAGIHEFARNSDVIFMANYAQTVNVIGCIKTTGAHAAWDATGLPLLLYRREFGAIPVAVEGGRPIDVMAAWVADRTALTIGVVNPLPDAVDVPFTLTNAAITGDGAVWTIAGTDPMLYNVPGEPPRLEIVESPVTGLAATLPVPGYSICLFRLPVR
jgi:alpha-N-arabinofuranosidase